MNPKLKMILFALVMTVVASANVYYRGRKYFPRRNKNSN